ncbi:MAG: sigma-70 family RNA polymerase sigma factor [Myxococcales bacterium]|nr:sigma-70 family RNA polymerase sigma factor [Myxococcales bacterium]MCB9715206.1 sigma-70 family RNA polymerase sigma factor [Myxococcales bacterium]
MIHRGTPDEELLEALRGGDLRAFDVLYLRYERRLFGYIRRMVVDRDLAEDLMQDVVLTVLRDRSYDPQRGRFAAWLFTVARNRCLQHERHAAVRERPVPEPRPAAADPEAAVDRHHRVRTAMAGLTDAQQQLLLLKQVGELTYREIADIHGVAEGTIKSRLHAATKAFRRRLAEIGGG